MKSKLIVFLIVLAIISSSVKVIAQDGSLRAMFVNDNSVYFPNTETVLTSLRQNYLFDTIVFFNAVDSMRAPTYEEMRAYWPLIWYTSTDGVDRYLWNGDDTDNQALMLYLEDGGIFWLMGNDFLYDRYGTAPVSFQPGDFPYDYLGIEQYAAQSYGDDGGLGVEMLTYAANDFITMVPDTLRWIYETLWWVDGCVPTSQGIPFYRMAPDSYILSPYYPAVMQSSIPTATINSISLFFDPALIDTEENRMNLFDGILEYIRLFIPYGLKNINKPIHSLKLTPNPATYETRVLIDGKSPVGLSGITIYDLSGRIVKQCSLSAENQKINVSGISKGIYIIGARNPDEVLSTKLIVD
ncbi:MAG: T9SS type A sorting domain-containing protein [Bacteroidota bacterium]